MIDDKLYIRFYVYDHDTIERSPRTVANVCCAAAFGPRISSSRTTVDNELNRFDGA